MIVGGGEMRGGSCSCRGKRSRTGEVRASSWSHQICLLFPASLGHFPSLRGTNFPGLKLVQGAEC